MDKRNMNKMTRTAGALAAACAAALLLAACGKEDPVAGEEIVIALGDDALGIETKTTNVTSMPSSLYWGATTGTRGNSAETKKWAAASATVSSNKIATGHYQPATAVAYNYYVSNVTFTVPNTGNVTMSATNTTDVVCGWAAASTSTSPSVALNHIFARTGTITDSAPTGYAVSNVTYKIVEASTSAVVGTAGTYNLSTGAWTAATTRLSSQTAITGASNLYLIPGTYKLYVTYTIATSNGDWSATYTKSGDVALSGGKVNNITVTYPSPSRSQIQISVSLNSWGTNAVSVTVS